MLNMIALGSSGLVEETAAHRVDGCGPLIRALDWASTSLGPIVEWPQSLTTTLSVLLCSPVPMFLLWSKAGRVLYNDAFAKIVGDLHPTLLGSKVEEGWPELAAHHAQVLETGLAGETLSFRDFELSAGVGSEQKFVELDYSPVFGDNGEPAGVLCILSDTTERVRTVRRLRDGQERMHLAAGAARIGTWDLDLTNGCGQMDRMALEISGMVAPVYTVESWAALVHEADRERVISAFKASLLEGGPAYQVEFRGANDASDGGERWLASHGAVLRDSSSGSPLRALGIVRDVTAEKRARADVEESEARFRILVDAIPSFVWFATRDGALHYMNDRWYEYTGQTPQEALPHGWATTLHPDDADRTRREWDEARALGASYSNECRYRRADGAYRWHVARAEPVRDATGNIVRWFGTSTDIHEQKLAIERLELALDAGAIIGTWVWDVRSDVFTADERFAQTYGLEAEQCRAGLPIACAISSIHEEDRARVDRSIQDALERGDGYRCEYRVKGANGRYRWVEASGQVELSAAGEPLRFPGVAVDIDARREAEERERLLAREVDHRSKNLLGVVQSVIQLTRDDDVASLKASVSGRIQALARAHSLLSASRWEGVELGELLREELAPFARQGDERVRVSGSALRLGPTGSQALALTIHELVTNAAKYGALKCEAGSVNVNWRLVDGDGGRLLELLWVELGGPSVTAPTKRGFGSTVIRSSIERQLGGTLALDWRHEGLRCTILIPAAQLSEPSTQSSKTGADVVPAGAVEIVKGRRVLVVEDEALIALQVEQALEELGCEVVGPAASVGAALDLLRRSPPDAAVLDVNLNGERSDRIAQALVALGVPFLYCTGYADPTDLIESDSPVERLSKPLDPGLLAGALRRLF